MSSTSMRDVSERLELHAVGRSPLDQLMDSKHKEHEKVVPTGFGPTCPKRNRR